MDFCINTRIETELNKRYVLREETIEKEVPYLSFEMPLEDFLAIWDGCNRGGYVAQKAIASKYSDFVSNLKEL